jgi:hypothetical protein
MKRLRRREAKRHGVSEREGELGADFNSIVPPRPGFHNARPVSGSLLLHFILKGYCNGTLISI